MFFEKYTTSANILPDKLRAVNSGNVKFKFLSAAIMKVTNSIYFTKIVTF